MKDAGEILLATATTVGIVLAGAYIAAWMLDLHGVPHPRDRQPAPQPDLPAMPSAQQWQREVDRRMQMIEAESRQTRETVMQLVDSLTQLLPAGHSGRLAVYHEQQRATA